jgi:hypothetical protein
MTSYIVALGLQDRAHYFCCVTFKSLKVTRISYDAVEFEVRFRRLTGSRSNLSKPDRKDGIRHDASLQELGTTYGRFGKDFDCLFPSGNHNVARTVQQYLCGLIQAEKRNMERKADSVPYSDDQVLQNFPTHSSWGIASSARSNLRLSRSRCRRSPECFRSMW